MSNTQFIGNTSFRFDSSMFKKYTKVCDEILNEENLSSLAKILYINTVKFHKSQTHFTSIDTLAKTVKEGRDAVAKALNELIEFGYIKRIERKNDYGLNNGYNYEIFAEPIPMSKSSEIQITDKTDNKNINIKNKNNVVVDTINLHLKKIITLYNSFKIEKRVMPHVISLFKKYSQYFSLDIFEYIFIQASENGILKKYNYMKSLFESFYDNKVFSANDLVIFNQEFKLSKNKKNNYKKSINKNSFHNLENESFRNYSSEELDDIIEKQQYKHNKK